MLFYYISVPVSTVLLKILGDFMDQQAKGGEEVLALRQFFRVPYAAEVVLF
jgi:hypothetical protein